MAATILTFEVVYRIDNGAQQTRRVAVGNTTTINKVTTITTFADIPTIIGTATGIGTTLTALARITILSATLLSIDITPDMI